MNGYWFTSSLFKIEPGEDEEINPGCYGRQLAVWLKKQLEERGYSVEPIINEDWGRCLMCSRDPFMLWVGCGNMDAKPRGDVSREFRRCLETSLATSDADVRCCKSSADSKRPRHNA